MKMTLFTIFFVITSNLWAQEGVNTSLPCSSNGTYFHYINGVLTNENGAKKSASLINEVIKEVGKLSVDSEGEIDTENQNLNVKNISNVTNNTTERLQDFAEFAAQRLSEFYPEKDAWNIVGHLYFGSLEAYSSFPESNKELTESELLSLEKKIEEKTQKATQTFIETMEIDVEKVVLKIRDKLKSGKKVVLISHSQGNMFSNKAYEILSNDEEMKQYMNQLGSLHVASPAGSHLNSSRHIEMTSGNDLVVTGLSSRPNDFKWVDITSSFSALRYAAGSLGHGFSYYLSSNSKAEIENEDGSKSYKSGRELFKEKLVDLLKKLDPNCPKPTVSIDSASATKLTNIGRNILYEASYSGSGQDFKGRNTLDYIEIRTWDGELFLGSKSWQVESLPGRIVKANLRLIAIDAYGQKSDPVYETIEMPGCFGADCCYEEEEWVADEERCILPPTVNIECSKLTADIFSKAGSTSGYAWFPGPGTLTLTANETTSVTSHTQGSVNLVNRFTSSSGEPISIQAKISTKYGSANDSCEIVP